MAHYLVKAKAKGNLAELKERLERSEIVKMHPFGKALNYSLNNARLDKNGYAVWEEEDYCSPPLAMERADVLDDYFSDLSVKHVDKGEGWRGLETLPKLFNSP